MDKKLVLITFAALVLLAYPVKADTEWVYTDLYFNIAAVDELTVTLLDETPVTSSPTGTAATNIEFNSTDGTDLWLNATVSGGPIQDASSAIMVLDNTGNTNLEVNISINASLGSCLGLRYNTTWADDPSVNATDVGTTNITLDDSFTPAEAAINMWLWGNFSSCLETDDEVKKFGIWVTTV